MRYNNTYLLENDLYFAQRIFAVKLDCWIVAKESLSVAIILLIRCRGGGVPSTEASDEVFFSER